MMKFVLIVEHEQVDICGVTSVVWCKSKLNCGR